MPRYFAWKKGLRGPTPVILYDEYGQTGTDKKRDEDILFIIELDPKLINKNLNSLAILYPYVEG